MKAKKHIEFDRVFVYLTDGKTDILWFTSEDVMRRVGECLVELERTHGNVQEDGAIYVTKAYTQYGIRALVSTCTHCQEITFTSEKQMRRAGQCLIDLARIGGNEVEITDEITDK